MPASNIATFPLHASFLDALAEHILALYGGDPLSLARLHVILPNYYACSQLKKYLQTKSGDASVLLPRMYPLSACGELLQKEYPDVIRGHDILLASTLSDTERLTLMARQVYAFQSTQQRFAPSMQHAMELAKELLHLFDQCEREGVDLGQLSNAVPVSLHKHWRDSQRFLSIVTEHLPAHMNEMGCASRQTKELAAIEQLATLWADDPPDYPVIVAGSTGTVKATRALLKVVAEMKHGQVILPALDVSMDADVWQSLEPAHPQYALKILLGEMGVSAGDVKLLSADTKQKEYSLPQAFLHACVPASAHSYADTSNIALPSIVADNEIEEAKLAATLMRKAYADGHRIIALVCPDETLLKHVSHCLNGYGVSVKSGQQPATQHPYIALIYSIMQVIQNPHSPLELLSCLKHLMHHFVSNAEMFQDDIARLEIHFLRNVNTKKHIDFLAFEARHAGFSDAMMECLSALSHLKKQYEKRSINAVEYVARIEQVASSFLNIVECDETFHDVQAIIQRIKQALTVFDDMDPSFMPSLFYNVCESMPLDDDHANVTSPHFILKTPMQARLEHYDYVILAGLNEGVWPHGAATNGWLNSAMQQAVGMEDKDALIGTMAHDVLMLCASKHVVWLRSRRCGAADAEPSRWWQRMNILCNNQWRDTDRILDIIRVSDQSEHYLPTKPPSPIMPESCAVEHLSVTGIERLYRDPYGFYARDILGLKPLEALDALPDHRTFGVLVHHIIEQFHEELNGEKPAEEMLVEAAKKVFKKHAEHPPVMLLWWPRFMQMVPWLMVLEERAYEKRVQIESERAMTLKCEDYELYGRIDRCEKSAEGDITIIDYKTGQPPTAKEVTLGYACQLPLLAALYQHTEGSYPAELNYWWLKGGLGGGKEHPAARSLSDDEKYALMDQQIGGFKERWGAYRKRQLPFYSIPVPAMRPGYNDYEHLARIDAWLYQ